MTPSPSWFKGKRVVGDTETDGLLRDVTRFWCASFINLDDPADRVHFGPDTVSAALSDMVREARMVVFHNGIGFDIPAIEKVYPRLQGTIDRTLIRDTLVMSRLANSRRGAGEQGNPYAKAPHSIAAWGWRFGVPKPEHEDWSSYTPEMRHRNEQDTYIGFLVLKACLRELKGFSRESIDSEHDLAWLLSDMERDGFYLHRDRAHSLYVETKQKADELEHKIQRAFPRRSSLVREVNPKVTKDGGFALNQTKCLGDAFATCVGGPFSLFEWEDFNIDSPKQRVERLLERGWVPKNFTKPSRTHPDGQPKFDAEDIEDDHDLPSEAKLIGTYLLLRSRQRLGEQWLDLCDSNSYVHGEVAGIGTASHRMSHRNPNFANLPSVKTKKIDGVKVIQYGVDGFYGFESRNCFGADPRIKDQVLIGADLTAIQLRAFAHYVEDENYIDLVVNHKDIHEAHAELLGVERDNAKTWIYAWLLGAGFKKLGSILKGSVKDGKESSELFMERIPGVKRLKTSVIPAWSQKGWMPGLDGRRVPCPSEHLGLAFVLQSFEKCVFSHSCIRLREWAVGNNVDFKFRALVHDELQGTVSLKYANEIREVYPKIVTQVGVDLGSKSRLDAACSQPAETWAYTH